MKAKAGPLTYLTVALLAVFGAADLTAHLTGYEYGETFSRLVQNAEAGRPWLRPVVALLCLILAVHLAGMTVVRKLIGLAQRKGLLLTLVLVALLLPNVARAAVQDVYLRNTSTVMTDAQLRNALPALQAQVSLDFAPVWNIDAHLVFIGKQDEPADAPVITVSDDATMAGALGYHDVCHQDGHGAPCGFVFAKTTIDDGEDPMVTLDHELLEMLADPYTTTMVKVGRRFYIQEVCDAPESGAYAYTRPGADGTAIALSDFVTPVWFRPGHVGPYDFRGFITRPLQLLPGGYISWVGADGQWHQAFKRHAGFNVL